MNQQVLAYLKQDQIGRVIAQGLADVYTKKPQTPVKYLAQWLKNYSANQKKLQEIYQDQQIIKKNLVIHDETATLQQIKNKQKAKVVQAELNKVQKFKQLIQHHEYQQELLDEQLPQFVEKYLKLTGCYVGQLSYPKKQITEQDIDENAHLDVNAPKLINYIGSSNSHKHLMLGKTLPVDKGVTGGAFALSLDDQPPKVNQEGQPIASQPQPKFVYVANVVRNEKMHFFRLPKLGAFLVVPLIYNSFLKQSTFDTALEDKKKYLDQLKEFNESKESEISQLNTELQEQEKKLTQLTEKNADQSQTSPIKQHIKELQQQITDKKAENKQYQQPQLTLEKRQFVFCSDNLGCDEEFSADTIDFIVGLVKHFRDSWQNKEKQLLFKDVQTQVQYLGKLNMKTEQAIERLQKSMALNQEQTKEVQQITDQSMKAYKQEQMQYNSLKKHIIDDPVYQQSFLVLKKFRVVKFKNVIQNMLYFLGYKKIEINLQGRTTINWKLVKDKYITKESYNKILNFVVQGPKNQQFTQYAKTPLLLQFFQVQKVQEIMAYNVGLGALVQFIKKALKHRTSNYNLRKNQKQVQRKQREDLIASNQKIKEDRAVALQTHRNSLPPEQVEGFNQQQWLSKYDTEHPLADVPEQIKQDIDNDM